MRRSHLFVIAVGVLVVAGAGVFLWRSLAGDPIPSAIDASGLEDHLLWFVAIGIILGMAIGLVAGTFYAFEQEVSR